MAKIQRGQNTKTERFKFPEYSVLELKSLNRLFDEKYNGCNTVADKVQWLIDEGGLTKNGEIITTGWDYRTNKMSEIYPICDYPTQYEILFDKYEKAGKLIGRKEFAIRKQLETYANAVGVGFKE